MTGDRSLRDYDLESGDEAVIDDPLVFLAQPDSLIVTARVRRAATASRSARRVPMRHDGGREAVHRARHHEVAAAWRSAFGGNLAVMDIYAAQMVFGRGRTFDRIDLALERGRARSTRASAAHRAGARARASRWSRPRRAASSSSRCSASTRLTANITSVFALFIGMFIIYNSFSIAVTQRRARDRHPARARRDSRGRSARSSSVESAIGGLVGSLARRRGGHAHRARASPATSAGCSSEHATGCQQRATTSPPDPWLLRAGAGDGRCDQRARGGASRRGNAARVDPVKALQKGAYQVLGDGREPRSPPWWRPCCTASRRRVAGSQDASLASVLRRATCCACSRRCC